MPPPLPPGLGLELGLFPNRDFRLLGLVRSVAVSLSLVLVRLPTRVTEATITSTMTAATTHHCTMVTARRRAKLRRMEIPHSVGGLCKATLLQSVGSPLCRSPDRC